MPNYLYNGLKLPALPKWDREAYPYAYINRTLSVRLYVSKVPITYGPKAATGNINVTFVEAGSMSCGLSASSNYTEWDSFSTLDSDSHINTHAGEWTNHDIINTEDGSVYLAASDPVPVLEWQKHDAYKPNSKWDGNTFYRVMGSEWVKQDGVVPVE